MIGPERRSSVRQRGFTLVELMIVVAIIGVLAAVAIPAFSRYIRRSRSRFWSDDKEAFSALYDVLLDLVKISAPLAALALAGSKAARRWSINRCRD